MDALTLLHGRRSCAALGPPAPDEAALDAMLRAALRAPDFLRLHPYAFLVAAGDGLDRLGAMLARAAAASRQPPEVAARAPRMPHRAPMVLVVAARAREHAVVPRSEQELCAACAAHALLLAATAQGYAGLWRTGWPARVPAMLAELGLEPEDRLIGFLYLGTATRMPEPPPAAEPAAFLRRL